RRAANSSRVTDLMSGSTTRLYAAILVKPSTDTLTAQCIPKLSASERGVYAASLSLPPQRSLNSNLVGSFTLKRPKGRAPTNRQLLDAPVTACAGGRTGRDGSPS